MRKYLIVFLLLSVLALGGLSVLVVRQQGS